MHKTMKSIMKGLEHPLKQYAQEMDSGKQMTEKDSGRLANLTMAMAFTKLLCMLEEMKEEGEKGGKHATNALGKMMHNMKSSEGMEAMMNAIGLPQIGFTPPENHHIGNVPYGNQGGGSYGEMNNDMEMRRGRSSRTGRYVHRAEMDDNMTDNYDMENRQGQPGTGQGNTGGNTGRR